MYFCNVLMYFFRRVSLALVVAALSSDSEWKPLLIIALLGVYSLVQFRVRPFANEMENLFDLMATLIIMLTFAENVWAESAENAQNSVPVGLYFTFALNMLYLLALILAVMWPLILSFFYWTKRRMAAQRERELMQVGNERLADFDLIVNEEQEMRHQLQILLARIDAKNLSLSQVEVLDRCLRTEILHE